MARKLRKGNEKERADKKRKKTMLVWSLFVAFLFIGSTIASVVLYPLGSNTEDEIDILNYTFVRAGQGWNLQYNDNEIKFTFLPSQIKGFNISDEFFNILKSSPQFLFSTNSSSELVSLISYGKLQLSNEWGKAKPTYILYGFLEPLSNYSQVNCDNSSLAPVLVFEKGNTSRVSKLEERCYQIDIDSNYLYDIMQFFDLMGYIRLGVIDKETFFNNDESSEINETA
jgi:hypothetical protein